MLTELTAGDVDIARFTKPGALPINYNVKQAEITVWVFRRVRAAALTSPPR